MGKLKFLLIAAVLTTVFYLSAAEKQKSYEVDMRQAERVSSFLLWQYKEKTLTAGFCEYRGFPMTAYTAMFDRLTSAEQQAAVDFMTHLPELERRAFKKELDAAYAEIGPQISDRLQKSYEEARRMYVVGNSDFSFEDYCAYLNENAEEILGKIYQKAFQNVSGW